MTGPHKDHQELQHLLGGYVLGGLGAAERHRLEEHLPDCQECSAELTRFAVVPGLLQLAAATGIDPEPVAPAESLPRLLAAARARRRQRQRRMLLVAAATVVVLAAAAIGGWQLTRPPAPPAGTPLVAADAPSAGQPAGQAPSGQVVLESREWGTQIRLTMYYVGTQDGRLSAWAVANDGQQEQAASWATPDDGRCYVVGATSIERDRLVRVDIRTADGRTVLHADG